MNGTESVWSLYPLAQGLLKKHVTNINGSVFPSAAFLAFEGSCSAFNTRPAACVLDHISPDANQRI